jgi:signal transduction histidine kinase
MNVDLPTTDQTFAARVVASLTEGVVVFAADGRVLTANPALLAMLDLADGNPIHLDEFFPVASDLHHLATQALSGTLAQDEDIDLRNPNGVTRWLRVNAMLLRDEHDEVHGAMLTLKEISELKSAERHMWQVEKMSALGRLASSVAHEVGNPLGAIDIQLQLLQEDIVVADGELATKVLRRLGIARTEMRRLDGIVQNFLRFSRPPALHLKQTSPNDMLRHIRDLVAPEAREKGIDLHCDLDASLPMTDADENQLSQSLLNILINAFQAVGEQGHVRFAAHTADGDILINISDNGPGIPIEDLERVFEFYYTTKDEGTGLGLSIAQRIIHQHGGTLLVESGAGEGTQISIRLPGIQPRL